jgi:hemerythrin superfamily protein
MRSNPFRFVDISPAARSYASADHVITSCASPQPTNPLEPTMPTTKRSEPDACSLLDTDHRNVKKMFKEYETLAGSKAASASQKKRDLANQICMELTVHAQIEEEIFYPAVRQAIKDTDLLDEAEVEHASAKELIAQIQDATDADDKFDAKVTVLGEYVDHHIKEERNEIFVKARAARGLDLVALREQLETRKEELMGELTGAPA